MLIAHHQGHTEQAMMAAMAMKSKRLSPATTSKLSLDISPFFDGANNVGLGISLEFLLAVTKISHWQRFD
jgi:hypothetical protein